MKQINKLDETYQYHKYIQYIIAAMINRLLQLSKQPST